MLLGLSSALGFGFADLFGAVSTRRLGVPQTILIIQAVSAAILSLVLLTPAAGTLSPNPDVRLEIVAAGALGTVSFFSFYRALRLGPVSIVSPVFASYAALTVILSVAFNGERLSALTDVAIALTIGGVVLASAAGGGERQRLGRQAQGVPFALVATLAWGVASFLLGRAGQQTGWFFPVYGARLVQFAGTIGVAAVLAAKGALGPVPGRRSVLIACASALCDNVGNAAFVRGSQVGLVSITSAVSASFPLIVIAGSMALFGERPSARQWVGILAAITGLILLGLAR